MDSGLVGMEEPYHEQRIAPGRPHPQYDLSHKMMVTLSVTTSSGSRQAPPSFGFQVGRREPVSTRCNAARRPKGYHR